MAAADELLDEAVLAAGARDGSRGGGGHGLAVEGEPDVAFAGPVGRLDHARVADLVGGGDHLVERAADERARLGDAGRGEPLALAELRDGERRRLGRDGVRQAEPGGDAGGARDGVVGAGGEQAVDLLGPGEPLDRGLVLDRDDRAPVGLAEAGGGRVAVGGDDGEPAPPGRREDAELRRARAEHEETLCHAAIVAAAPVGAADLASSHTLPPDMSAVPTSGARHRTCPKKTPRPFGP